MGMNITEIIWTVQLRFVLALALGFLVGLERESTKTEQRLVFGGVRTHPIISMFGFGCAWLYQIGATAMLPIGLLAITTLTGIAYVGKIRADRFGTTSEISALLTFVVGALAMLVDVWIAMAMGVVNTILLSEKAMLESYVERLSKVEFLAAVKFLLVTVIILPVLPNIEFTPFHINPTKVWQVVVVVSSLGFAGYLLEKKFGEKVGLWLSGILGGIVSSTAVTISMGRMARSNPERAESALQATLLASSVSYLRMLVLVWIISPALCMSLLRAFSVIAIAGILLSIRMFNKEEPSREAVIAELQNPFEIRPAIVFAMLFVFLSIATVFVRSQLGNGGILALSAIVGLTDVTPFIMTLAHSPEGVSQIIIASIVLAMLSNTIAKAFYFCTLSEKNRKEAALRYSIMALIHLPFIIW
jgi:uncharacterized membrane protein (DUF4010 family)